MKHSGLVAASLPPLQSQLSAAPCPTPSSVREQEHHNAVASVDLLSFLLPQQHYMQGRARKLWERGIKCGKVYCSAR